ncbi:MAG: carboxymuconolactone decarboxylase family protein [Planctomycetota bacterium]
MRRLTGDEHLGPEFATTWPEYEMDAPTRALLRYASKLTDTPSLMTSDDTESLRECGWSEDAIWEIAALTSFFSFSGRLEAASGLPQDRIPEGARIPEARGA